MYSLRHSAWRFGDENDKTLMVGSALRCHDDIRRGKRTGRRAKSGRRRFLLQASLKNALDDVAAQWQRETGKKAVISYAQQYP